MVKVIETNLSMPNGEIVDFQSRVIEVENWMSYVNEIGNGDAIIRPAYIGNMHGYSLLPNAKVENFTYDEYHLSYDVYYRDGWFNKKFAYLIGESNEIKKTTNATMIENFKREYDCCFTEESDSK